MGRLGLGGGGLLGLRGLRGLGLGRGGLLLGLLGLGLLLGRGVGDSLLDQGGLSAEDGKEVVVEKDVSSVACVTRRGCAACEWEACDDAT